ncbi:MAG TPA: alpha/beta hydrolase family protein [Terriglobales bacterium]|nr:alpha/beta hydrolase family protein [Terriglobales bacterium]
MRKAIVAVVFLLSCLGFAQSNPTVVTVPFDSQALHQRAPFNVLLPVGYQNSIQRYPVLYLLHGIGDHYDTWVKNTNLVEYARPYPLIIVMPEGDKAWYVNGVVPNSRWEDYIMKEVMPYVDSHYRTLQGQRMEATAGLSMGGYGALMLGLKYRDLFSVAASLSGALGVTEWTPENMGADFPDWIRKSVMDAFGPAGSPQRKEYGLAQLLNAPVDELPFIYLDCGTEDSLLVHSRNFSKLLQEKKIPHEYREQPGIHEWPLWDHQIQEVLRLLAERWELKTGN